MSTINVFKYRATCSNGDIYEVRAKDHTNALIRILRIRAKHHYPSILKVEVHAPKALRHAHKFNWVECAKVGI